MPSLIATLAAVLPLAAAAPSNYPTAGCTSKSFDPSFAWTVEDFTYSASYIFTTPAHQNSYGTVAFNLTNPAVQETVSCSAYSSQLQDFFYGTQDFNCTNAPGANKTTPTTFTYSRPSGQLDVNQTWTCDDQDNKYP